MKVYWVNLDGAVFCGTNPRVHKLLANKFVYWAGEDILLMGSIELADHPAVCRQANLPVTKRLPDGAGSASNGKIVSWKSTSLNQLTTPAELREPIAKALGFKNAESPF